MIALVRVITNDLGVIEEETIEEMGDAWQIFLASLYVVETDNIEYIMESVS